MTQQPTAATIRTARQYAEKGGYDANTSTGFSIDFQMIGYFDKELGADVVNSVCNRSDNYATRIRRFGLYAHHYRKLFELLDEKTKKQTDNDEMTLLLEKARKYADGIYGYSTSVTEDNRLFDYFVTVLGEQVVGKIVPNRHLLYPASYKQLFRLLDAKESEKGKEPVSTIFGTTVKSYPTHSQTEEARQYAFAGGKILSANIHPLMGNYFEREIINKSTEVSHLILSLQRGSVLWPSQYQTLFKAEKEQRANKDLLKRLDELTAGYISRQYEPGELGTDRSFALLLVSAIGEAKLSVNDPATQKVRELLAKAISTQLGLSQEERYILVRTYWHYLKPDFLPIVEEGQKLEAEQEALNKKRDALLKKITLYEATQRGN